METNYNLSDKDSDYEHVVDWIWKRLFKYDDNIIGRQYIGSVKELYLDTARLQAMCTRMEKLQWVIDKLSKFDTTNSTPYKYATFLGNLYVDILKSLDRYISFE
ncbi:MAG: hypothetical protein JWN78_2487 [Bacteroidota bacterium]|nr:hypothetical protein [Bacteroidota bacterium]